MMFRSDPESFRGSIAALVTPFDEVGALDAASLRRLVGWQLAEGSHGISIGGTTGEPSAQTVEERAAAVAAVVDEVAGRVPVVAGTGSDRIETTLALTGAAQQHGADAVLVATPHYAYPTQEGLYGWFSTVCGQFPDLPVIAYNIPQRSVVDLAAETVARLRRAHPNLVGLKDSTDDLGKFTTLFRQCGRDLLVWTGQEALCLPTLPLGVAGFIGALANLAPRAVAGLYDRYQTGDHTAAADLHFALDPLVRILFVETNPSPTKHVLASWNVIASERVRQPLAPLSPAGRDRVRQLLAEAKELVDPDTGATRPPG
jgi:4-hydroxy-tetrahydrodipicolinate synthase